MMAPVIINWITLGLVFLLPMIPAFVLYRFLPSTGDAGGSLYGIPIKLTGSIAGYVVVLLIGVNYVSIDDMAGHSRYKLYTIGGSVKFEGLMADELDYRRLDISYAPRREEVGQPYGEGVLDWNVVTLRPADKGADGDRPVVDILISYPDFVTEKLPLSAAEASGDALSLRFKPVMLRKKLKAKQPSGVNADVVVLE